MGSAIASKPKHSIETVDRAQLDAFLGKMVSDLGAGMSAALVLIGDGLGLYKALGNSETALTPEELATKTSTDPRYVREWLAAQAASGYVNYDAAAKRYSMSPEQSLALAWDDSPVHMPGAFQIVSSVIKDQHKISEAFRAGTGVGWHEHHPALFEGTERFFRPNYAANLINNWIPALKGVKEKLERGALVADVGCGHGSSTILMAQAYPKSKFIGFDYHQGSIEKARQRAEAAGVGDRATFQVGFAKEFPGKDYDLVTFFDCLHDMGDPEGASRHVLSTLAKDGTWMIVEPFANDDVKDNLNPVGRVFYSASTMICTPASRAQEVGAALGAQAGEGKIREVVTKGGFKQFRRATETPFNLVFEAKP
jgi:SAM-dependent methyltransferase